ncbi:hypothetical protein Mfla_1311 [Methylobacillus flagellatus KT]|uniref:Uncharacterized protein n=1 Tax=Methylobacillus flagellatus (strain ATCC 51484 / DSM 6875 / VKM B-1610 / KT) TaxID=265072 RepID=Q1H1Q8_METFK|nr:hypothetical protein Mfla_1311 [Methylobacillus flagellatus KT]
MHGILIAYLVLLSVVLLSVSISYLKKGFNNKEVTLTSKDLIKRGFFIFISMEHDMATMASLIALQSLNLHHKQDVAFLI